jgi:hypothetical protein
MRPPVNGRSRSQNLARRLRARGLALSPGQMMPSRAGHETQKPLLAVGDIRETHGGQAIRTSRRQLRSFGCPPRKRPRWCARGPSLRPVGGRPMCGRIRSTMCACSIMPINRNRPPHSGHSSTSSAKRPLHQLGPQRAAAPQGGGFGASRLNVGSFRDVSERDLRKARDTAEVPTSD